MFYSSIWQSKYEYFLLHLIAMMRMSNLKLILHGRGRREKGKMKKQSHYYATLVRIRESPNSKEAYSFTNKAMDMLRWSTMHSAEFSFKHLCIHAFGQAFTSERFVKLQLRIRSRYSNYVIKFILMENALELNIARRIYRKRNSVN